MAVKFMAPLVSFTVTVLLVWKVKLNTLVSMHLAGEKDVTTHASSTLSLHEITFITVSLHAKHVKIQTTSYICVLLRIVSYAADLTLLNK